MTRPPTVSSGEFSAVCAALRKILRPVAVADDLIPHVREFPGLIASRAAKTSFAALLSDTGHIREADTLFRALGAPGTRDPFVLAAYRAHVRR